MITMNMFTLVEALENNYTFNLPKGANPRGLSGHVTTEQLFALGYEELERINAGLLKEKSEKVSNTLAAEFDMSTPVNVELENKLAIVKYVYSRLKAKDEERKEAENAKREDINFKQQLYRAKTRSYEERLAQLSADELEFLEKIGPRRAKEYVMGNDEVRKAMRQNPSGNEMKP